MKTTERKSNRDNATERKAEAARRRPAARREELNDGDFELMDFLERLRDPLMANAPRGSALVKAFALYRALVDLEADELDVAKLRAAMGEVVAEWSKLSAREKACIRGGWPDRGQQPTVKAWLAEQARYIGPEIDWALRLTPSPDRGQVDFEADWHLFNGTEPVTLLVRPGTPKAEVVRWARGMVAALERYWRGAITLGPETPYLRLPMTDGDAAKGGEVDVILDRMEGHLAELQEALRRGAQTKERLRFIFGPIIQRAEEEKRGAALVVDMKGKAIMGRGIARAVGAERRGRAKAAAA
jgi:hypothetical protein